MSSSSTLQSNGSDRVSGARHLGIALRLAALAWLLMTVQEVLLFSRPTPYGGSYAERWYSYFPYAVCYNVLAVMLASAIPMLGWLLWYGREVRPAISRLVHGIHLGLLMFVVALDHADNEVMRFMGVHLSLGLLHAYHRVNAWGNDMLYIFAYDQGGPGLPFVILIASPMLLWLVGKRLIRHPPLAPRIFPMPLAFAVTLFPLLVPVIAYDYFPGRLFIWQQTRPALLTLYTELKGTLSRGDPPERFENLARDYQARWYQNSGDTAWRFPDRDRPMLRVPLTSATPVKGKPWNVLYIQLETFRGWNTGFLRPDLPNSPTPFLDHLAQDSSSAFWPRHLSMGPPTVSGMMAGLCSIRPHSSEIITTTFTYTALECLPAVLRRHGYVAEAFTVSDPDWDGEKNWLRQWYDRYHYNSDASNADRIVFRRAADRIRELGRGPRPFFASVISISNHYPFREREPQFTKDPVNRRELAINNTMRYTDDVVREFVESLGQEPWFENTLLIVFGDHGYELGEHARRGQHNGWRESVWVPLIIHGNHPRLPRGRQDEMATLLDLAPTITDLLGIRDSNPWMGSSLLPYGKRQKSFALVHWGAIWGEWDQFSMVVDPTTGKGLLYDAIEDPLQQIDISAQYPGIVTALMRQARDEGHLVDYLLEANWVWKRPTPMSSR
jgi:phosphoglycerol transferase MdoB-like AlkP superfamily enzyme